MRFILSKPRIPIVCAAMMILMLIVSLSSSKPMKDSVTIGKIEWRTDYDAALKEARQSKKPLWLHFGENPG